MLILEIEKYAIVIFGLCMAYAELRQAIYFKKAWTKWALGFMGIYWAVYYAYSIVRPYFNVLLPTHQVFVRAGILLTISFISANALMTLKKIGKHES